MPPAEIVSSPSSSQRRAAREDGVRVGRRRTAGRGRTAISYSSRVPGRRRAAGRRCARSRSCRRRTVAGDAARARVSVLGGQAAAPPRTGRALEVAGRQRGERLNVSRLATRAQLAVLRGRRPERAGATGPARRPPPPPGRPARPACAPRTATALMPLRAQDRPEPAAAGVPAVVAERWRTGRGSRRPGRSPPTCQPRPNRVAQPRPRRRRAVRPHRSSAGSSRTVAVVDQQHRRPSRAADDDEGVEAGLLAGEGEVRRRQGVVERSVSGDLATTANLAEVVSGVPTSGREHEHERRLRRERIDAGGRSRCSSQAPSPTPPRCRAARGRRARRARLLPSVTSTTIARPK